MKPYSGTSEAHAAPRSARTATRSRTSACSTPARSATRSRSSSSAATSTGSRRTSTSTATRSTAQTQDYIVAARELNSDGPGQQPAGLDQPAPRLHPRQRPGRRAGERDQRAAAGHRRPGRAAAVHQHRHRRRRVRARGPAGHRAAHLLRRADHRLLDRRGRGGRGRRASTTPTRRATPTTAGAACRWATSFNRLVFSLVLRRAQHPVQRLDQRQLEDHVRAEPGGPGRGRRAVADAGHRPVPGRGRRAGHLDRRRLHDAGELPVRRADVAGRRHGDRAAGRAAAARRGDQLHPQLGEGHRRRLRRHRHRLRLRRDRPRAADLGDGVPGRGQAGLGDLATACGRTSATRRTCSRSSASCSPSTTSTTPASSSPRCRSGTCRPTRRCRAPPGTAGSAQPPYYLLAGLPDQQGATFQLTSALVEPGAAVPLGVRVGELRSGDLRQDHGAGAAGGDPDAGAAAGAGAVPRLTAGQPGAQPAAAEPDDDRVRQPAHPAGGGRPALRRAGVHRAGGAERVVPGAGAGAGQLQRPGRLRRADLAEALEQVFGAGAGSAATPRRAQPAQPAPGTASPPPAPANADQAAAAAEIGSGDRPAARPRSSAATSPPRARPSRRWTRPCSGTSRARPPRPRRHRPRHRAAEAHPTPRG